MWLVVFSNYIFMAICSTQMKTAKYKTRLNKRTIEALLNELFVLDDQETNEATIRQYASNTNNKIMW